MSRKIHKPFRGRQQLPKALQPLIEMIATQLSDMNPDEVLDYVLPKLPKMLEPSNLKSVRALRKLQIQICREKLGVLAGTDVYLDDATDSDVSTGFGTGNGHFELGPKLSNADELIAEMLD